MFVVGIDAKGITDGFFDENFKLHKGLLSKVIRSYTGMDIKLIQDNPVDRRQLNCMESIVCPSLAIYNKNKVNTDGYRRMTVHPYADVAWAV